MSVGRSVGRSIGPSVGPLVGPSVMLLSAGRDEPANSLFCFYKLVPLFIASFNCCFSLGFFKNSRIRGKRKKRGKKSKKEKQLPHHLINCNFPTTTSPTQHSHCNFNATSIDILFTLHCFCLFSGFKLFIFQL